MSLTTDFKARFPEFTDAVVDTYMPIIEPVWPMYYAKDYNTYKEAVLNLVAHLMTEEVKTSKASSKGVASKAVGSVSTSYTASTRTGALADFFSATKYGQRFLYLTASQFGGLPV